MAEVTRKRTGELLRKLFEILMASPEGVAAGEAIKRLADSVTMSPYEAGVYEPSGTRRFEKIVRFGTVDCVKAGWLVKHKGTWSVTDAGVRAYNTIAEPDAFYRKAVRLYQQWRASQPDRNEKPTIEAATEEQSSDKSASITFEEAEEQAWGDRTIPHDDESVRIPELGRRSVEGYGLLLVVDRAPREGWRRRHHCSQRSPRNYSSSHQGPSEANGFAES
jgi:hypothetical protein